MQDLFFGWRGEMHTTRPFKKILFWVAEGRDCKICFLLGRRVTYCKNVFMGEGEERDLHNPRPFLLVR